MVGIRTRILLLDRSVLNVAAYGAIRADGGKGGSYDAIDPTAGIVFRSNQSQCQPVIDQRKVDHEIIVVIEPAAISAR